MMYPILSMKLIQVDYLLAENYWTPYCKIYSVLDTPKKGQDA